MSPFKKKEKNKIVDVSEPALTPIESVAVSEQAEDIVADKITKAREVVVQSTKVELAKEVLAKRRRELVQAETELRRYVRKDGGFRDGISDKDNAHAKGLLKILGRTEIAWDRLLDPEHTKDLTS